MPIIGIDYTPAFEQGGGIGRYVRELVAALQREPGDFNYSLFVAGSDGRDLPFHAESPFAWHPNPIPARWWARIWHRAHIWFPVEGLVGRVRLYHATDFVLPPTLPETSTLLTVHDLSFVRVPDAASPRLRRYLDSVVPRSIARADHILADSAATKADIIDVYGTSADKITVLYSGVDSHFQRVTDETVCQAVRARYALPSSPFILSVGTVQPRKNYARLVAALAQVRTRHDIDLVIVGGRGWLEDAIYQAVRDHDLSDHVHFAGYVDDADLRAVYSMAQATVIPSLYEGFGIPVLESMACGTPVITSDISSLPEVAGDAALLIDPHNTEAIADAIRRLLEDTVLVDTLTQRGLMRAHDFTWDRAAHQLRQMYETFI
jgi:glycosyltransferase involved in cell wall biosynthesis